MKRMLPLTLALVAAALAAGCITPTPQQLQSAEADRADAQKLLDGFAACIHQQDATGLRALVAPSLWRPASSCPWRSSWRARAG